MRFAIIIAIAGLTTTAASAAPPPIASPAASAAVCTRPAKPVFPDPKTADPAIVQKLDQAMQTYSASMNTYVQCLSNEAKSAEADGTATINAYNQKFLPEYNKRATGK